MPDFFGPLTIEPRRVYRRPFCLGHAASAVCSLCHTFASTAPPDPRSAGSLRLSSRPSLRSTQNAGGSSARASWNRISAAAVPHRSRATIFRARPAAAPGFACSRSGESSSSPGNGRIGPSGLPGSRRTQDKPRLTPGAERQAHTVRTYGDRPGVPRAQDCEKERRHPASSHRDRIPSLRLVSGQLAHNDR